MMKEVIVTDVRYSFTKKCRIITYERSPGNIAIAVTAECLCPKVGDKVWVLKNDELNIKASMQLQYFLYSAKREKVYQ